MGAGRIGIRGRRYVGKLVDIKSLTGNKNPGFVFNFFLSFFGRGAAAVEGVGGRNGEGRVGIGSCELIR